MAKYTFRCNHGDGDYIELGTNHETIYEVLEAFKEFLRGSGFSQELIEKINDEGNSDKYKHYKSSYSE